MISVVIHCLRNAFFTCHIDDLLSLLHHVTCLPNNPRHNTCLYSFEERHNCLPEETRQMVLQWRFTRHERNVASVPSVMKRPQSGNIWGGVLN